METPVEVLIHNELVGMKGTRGRLLAVGGGYYEVNCKFGEKTHRVLLPVSTTVVIAGDAEEEGPVEAVEIER